jgi:hypothetical protein
MANICAHALISILALGVIASSELGSGSTSSDGAGLRGHNTDRNRNSHTLDSCIQAIGVGGALNLTVASVLGKCAGTNTSDGSFVCSGVGSGVGNQIVLKQWLGQEDFTVTTELLLEVMQHCTGCCIVYVHLPAVEENYHVGLMCSR